MQQQASIEEFKQLPSVGETTAKTLKEAGYQSFADLVQASPTELHYKCDIVLSSTTHIISSAVQYLQAGCPSCTQCDFNPAWQEYSESAVDDDAEIVCSHCGWYGNVNQLRETADTEN